VLRLAVRVDRDQSELVLAELLELAPGGVEEVDVSDGVIEYAVYGAPGELPALPDVEAVAAGALIEVRTEEVADDWGERWREFHRPLVLDGSLTVRPPWEPPGETPIDLVVDPGQAFGTGAHATTRLCLELMLGLEAGGSFLDLGCGSGVLAIAAARLGFSPVLAVDNDPAALSAARSNAAVNLVAVEVARVDVRREAIPAAVTVAANLLTPLLVRVAPRLREGVQRVIASGVLAGEADEVARAFVAAGLNETERRVAGEWAALLLERRPAPRVASR
jgi:ribosomal protein L11 methyltransferase